MDFLQDLNEAQRQAVTSLDGPHMIIAGAGSGKTRVLTYRLAYIIQMHAADSFQLLALTFTNKAAREMKERIHTLVGAEARNIWMGTFHSIFARILRKEAEKIGYTSAFTVYDDDDSKSLVGKIIKEMALDDKKFKPRAVLNYISGAKNALVDPDEFAANHVTDTFTNVIANIYKRYNTRLFDSNAMDFDDLLVKPVELFDKHPDVLHYYQHRFRYILVDEYQDTNHAQYMIVKKLAAVHENICVVGDDAQSIYSFRGANIQNILNFRKDYPDTKLFKLEQNYRSTKNIVEAANNIIQNNKEQIQKLVFTENDQGDLIRVIEAPSETDESKQICDSIREQKMRFSYRNEDFAVLYRTNAQSRSVETELRRAGVRYRIFGGLSFYKRKEVKDVVAYLKLAVNPRDEAAIDRVINYPARGIGDTTMDKLRVAADAGNVPLWDVLCNAKQAGIQARAANAIDNFVTQVKTYGIKARDLNAYDAANFIANHTGILKELHTENSVESLSRWENVQELLNAAKEFTEDPDNDAHSLDAFLAEISLFTDQDQDETDKDFITLMTIHSAKGLEFPSVFVIGLEEELFPNVMASQTRADLEEERRLFYVAVTRARERLTLSYAKSRYKYGAPMFNEPSRFLREVGDEFLSKPQQRQRTGTTLGRSVAAEANEGGPATGTRLPGRFTRVSPATARAAAVTEENFEGDDLTGLAPGMNVSHAKFGEGKVQTVEGAGAARKATVFFQALGQKVLLLKYAKLKILS